MLIPDAAITNTLYDKVHSGLAVTNTLYNTLCNMSCRGVRTIMVYVIWRVVNEISTNYLYNETESILIIVNYCQLIEWIVCHLKSYSIVWDNVL